MKISIVGTGRAGTSFERALRSVGHDVLLVRHFDLRRLGSPGLVLLCVPDDEISSVAGDIPESDSYVVAHVAGSRNLSVLEPHRRVASIHPLAALPSKEIGAQRLVGDTYCVAGDEIARDVVASLRGRAITLSDDQRTRYHATATVAANHLVALMGHVKNLAEAAGLSLEDFSPLAEQALADVRRVGPEAALTGPASRGDMATIDAHLAAIPEAERSTYVALANTAFELSEHRRSQTPA
jgi:predicted short-subunit dehydrogenase-like oxidoreductase (DUF2520 family)